MRSATVSDRKVLGRRLAILTPGVTLLAMLLMLAFLKNVTGQLTGPTIQWALVLLGASGLVAYGGVMRSSWIIFVGGLALLALGLPAMMSVTILFILLPVGLALTAGFLLLGRSVDTDVKDTHTESGGIHAGRSAGI